MVNGWLSLAESSPQKSGIWPVSAIARVWTDTIEFAASAHRALASWLMAGAEDVNLARSEHAAFFQRSLFRRGLGRACQWIEIAGHNAKARQRTIAGISRRTIDVVTDRQVIAGLQHRQPRCRDRRRARWARMPARWGLPAPSPWRPSWNSPWWAWTSSAAGSSRGGPVEDRRIYEPWCRGRPEISCNKTQKTAVTPLTRPSSRYVMRCNYPVAAR